MHRVLERQIRRSLGALPSADTPREWLALLQAVSDTYGHADEDRQLLSRSLDLSSKEFVEINKRLRSENEIIEQKVRDRTEDLRKLLDTQQELGLELTKANAELRELDQRKSEFLSIAAHQLRTPLSAIKWTLSLLIDEDSENITPEQRSLLLKGYESNERMINLINEMLVVTRIESGKMQYNLSSIHIEDLIDSILLDFAGQAHVRNITLAFERPDTPLQYVNIDPEKIRAVIQNLVENALNYTTNGGTITLSAKLENNFIKVIVKDSGIGIPAHQQSSIFNKFFRADNAIKVQTDGSGLGLFVSKSIVNMHKGHIGFQSTEGVGSTFYFTIPCADAHT